MDDSEKLLKISKKCEVMSLISALSANYWNIIKISFEIPLLLINSILCILNAINLHPNSMRIFNIVVNGISVLLLSIQSKFKVPEKVELFKNLSNQFMLLNHSIENFDSSKNTINEITDKYDILLQQCKFEDIPNSLKIKINKTYPKDSLPIQLKSLELSNCTVDVLST